MSKPRTLGEYVRQARERAGLSQRQLAAKARIHPTRIARIENGDTGNRPTPEHLQGIADALEEYADIGDMLDYLGIKPSRPQAYFRRAYGMTEQEAEEAEAVIAQLRAHREQNKKPEGGVES